VGACQTAPGASCADANTLRTFVAPGTCNSGACTYTYTDSTCAHGCAAGACNASITVPKSGPAYTGPHMDPGLNADCPDTDLEPNDLLSQAVTAPLPIPDIPTSKITKLAICPQGPSPWSGSHDIDVFKVDLTSFSGVLALKVELTYDIAYGDLDVAILDETGRALDTEGTAVSNACLVMAASRPSVYYVAVVGANNVDSNRYELRIRTFSQGATCP
jgi:hypothetical protein